MKGIERPFTRPASLVILSGELFLGVVPKHSGSMVVHISGE